MIEGKNDASESKKTDSPQIGRIGGGPAGGQRGKICRFAQSPRAGGGFPLLPDSPGDRLM